MDGSLHVPDHERYNHTLRYQREFFARLPASGGRAIDIGCGEGIASRQLAALGYSVTAVDPDAPSLERARAQGTDGIDYRQASVWDVEIAPAHVVYAGAMLHHLDLRQGLRRLASLVAPGGRLVIVGLAANNSLLDAPRELVAALAHAIDSRRHPHWDHGAPTVWPPAHTYRDVEREVRLQLEGARYRRRLMWRYTVEWDRPTAT